MGQRAVVRGISRPCWPRHDRLLPCGFPPLCRPVAPHGLFVAKHPALFWLACRRLEAETCLSKQTCCASQNVVQLPTAWDFWADVGYKFQPRTTDIEKSLTSYNPREPNVQNAAGHRLALGGTWAGQGGTWAGHGGTWAGHGFFALQRSCRLRRCRGPTVSLTVHNTGRLEDELTPRTNTNRQAWVLAAHRGALESLGNPAIRTETKLREM